MEQLYMIRILADADALPVAVKEILYRASERVGARLILVANQPLGHPKSPLISCEVVASGPDEADHRIAEMTQPGDLIITADIPLAARAVEKGGVALNPRGTLYTRENVKQALAMRDLMSELRDQEIHTGGPAPFSQKDRQAFANQLDRYLQTVGK
jgi:hypothetical protein